MSSVDKVGEILCCVLRPLARFLCTLVFQLRVFNARNVPRQGAMILAVNHQSYLDPLFVGASVNRVISFMARSTLFRNRLFGALVRLLRAYPVERDSADVASIRHTMALLEAGKAVLVFPEGTRTRDGQLGPMKRGIGVLARRSGAVVVPTFVDGAFKAWPRTARLPVPAHVSVSFGKPLLADPTSSDRDFSERVRQALVDLQLVAASRRAQH